MVAMGLNHYSSRLIFTIPNGCNGSKSMAGTKEGKELFKNRAKIKRTEKFVIGRGVGWSDSDIHNTKKTSS